MSYYDNDYTDDMYDRYMHTGEGAEYFEDRAEEYPDEYIEEVETEKVVEYKDTNKMLDDTIRYLKLQIKEKERIIKEQKRIERDIDREEIKRIWQQLAIGTALALAGLVFMGIGELVCRWLEGQ